MFYVRPGSRLRDLRHAIRTTSPSLLYFNSLFSPWYTTLPLGLGRLLHAGIPMLLAPRGECSPGALRLSATKKSLFLQLSRLVGVHRRVTFHASTVVEADEIKRVFPNAPIAVAPDTPSPPIAELPSVQPKSAGSLRICFLSRVTPKKNLAYAIERLRELRGQVSLDIYGFIDDQDYWDRCSALIKGLPANMTVEYRGILRPEDVQATLARYDLFLLPTLGENFGHVFMEALSAGVPIVISDRTPWRDLPRERTGWDLPLEDPSSFDLVLREAVEWDEQERNARRLACRAYAFRKYAEFANLDAWRAMFTAVGART